MRKRISGATAIAVAITLSAWTPQAAQAQPVPAKSEAAAGALQAVQSGATDFSSQRRRARGHRGSNAAALGAATAIFGTIATIAAANAYRDRYYYAPYDYAPYGYAPGPVYYAPPRYYYGGPRYYAPPRHYAPRYHIPRGHWLPH